MKRTLIAAAVAGALGLPTIALADDSTVEVYGKLYPQFQGVRGTGATPTTQPAGERSTLAIAPGGNNVVTHSEVNASSSRLGFRGKEPLGGGLSAIWQIENQIDLDTGGDTFASRNSFVGLRGGFGAVKLGRMDTVYKDLGGPVSFLGVSAGNFVSESDIMSRLPFTSGSASRAAANFHRRQDNVVQYESPEFGGVQILAQYSPDERRSSVRHQYSWSAGVKYEAGPLYLALAHELHNDQFGGSLSAPTALRNANADGDGLAAPIGGARSEDSATRFSWAYKFGGTRIGGDIARLEYEESGGLTGRFQEYRKTAWNLSVEQKLSAVTLVANIARANDGSCSLFGGVACTTTGLRGRQASIGAGYSFSKRTLAFLLLSKNWNDSSARYDKLEVGTPDNGVDVAQAAIGISHSF